MLLSRETRQLPWILNSDTSPIWLRIAQQNSAPSAALIVRTAGRLQHSEALFKLNPTRILGELNRLLHEHLRYPETARRKGIEGALAIRFTLNTNGTATDVVVSESSGSHLLDRAAVRAISDIFPYPEPPDTPLHFTIPVTYRLAQSE